jgi:hypothetical protein
MEGILMRLVGQLSVVLLVASACGPTDRSSPGVDAGVGGADAGEPDNGLPAICNPTTNANPAGLKDVRYIDSRDTVYPTANWRIAVEPATEISWATFPGAQARESAFLLDLSDSTIEVAGFLVTRGGYAPTAPEESILAQTAIRGVVSGATTRASGSTITSLDGFETVVSTAIELTTAAPTDATALRAKIIPAILGRPAAEVTYAPLGWQSGSDTRFVLVMQTLHRAEDNQTLHMGAIARAFDYDNRGRKTGLHADDLANGSGLTVSANGEARECEDEEISQIAKADIIWVIDESGSMSDDRARIGNNAAAFFEKALDLGLDFRMGVTDMNDTSVGKFATRNADDSDERWILPGEAPLFATAVNKPSGPAAKDGSAEHGLTQMRNALARHLPRDDADPLMIRSDAKLAVIIVTDEKPDELENAGLLASGNRQPTAEQAVAIDAFLQPYIAELTAEQAVVHLISEPLPFATALCSGSGAEHAYGYYEVVAATGGQTGSICQLDLGPTLDAMLDSIVADASPLQLEYVPISASISVTRDGVVVPRSRQLGWDYRASSNAIVFYGMPLDPANPAEIVVGYRRWDRQVVE